jgi:hypothetical protein
LESLPDYKQQYGQAKTSDELNIVQAKYIIELKSKIYELWTYILKANKKKLRVMDLRKEKDVKNYKKFIEKE